MWSHLLKLTDMKCLSIFGFTPRQSEKQGKAIQSPERRLTCQSDKLPFLIQRTSLHGRAQQLPETGEESMGKIPYLFRPSPVFFCCLLLWVEALCFPSSETTAGWEEQSLWDSASPTSRSYKLFTISFSFLALYGEVQWVSFPFSFIHHSSQLGIVEGQLPGLPLTETLQICLK